MGKTITVSIAGAEYRLMETENEEYTNKVAAHLDAKISEITKSASVSLLEAAVLAGMNVTDEYFRALETSDNLRLQLKDYLEDMSKMKAEMSDLKRELGKRG